MQCFTRSSWNHIGVVVELRNAKPNTDGNKKCKPSVTKLVAHTYGRAGLIEAQIPKVKLRPLRKALLSWFCNPDIRTICWRQLEKPMVLKAEDHKKIQGLAMDYQTRPYEKHVSEFLKAVLLQAP